nr:UbiA family prenyltransferase [Micromonospora terminaliae]
MTIVRIRSCIAGAAATLVGCYLGTGTMVGTPARSAAAAASIAAAIAFANVVNDIADVDVDALGKPDRPLPAGRISSRGAHTAAAGAASLAMVSTVPLGTTLIAVMAALLVVSFLYSARLKGTVLFGNVLVAACASSPLLFGAAAAGNVTGQVLCAALLAFEFMLAYEVLKTLADRAGDAAAGLRTLATATRFRTSTRTLVALATALTITVFAAVPLTRSLLVYVTIAVPVLVAPIWYVVYRLHRGRPPVDIWDLMRFMRRAWLLGTVALLALR